MKPLSPNPLVSFIVPSFNQGKYIKQTIDSIIKQDYRPLEVIVIDGGSTDNTLDILHDYDEISEVFWVSELDSGPVEAVNKGFLRSKGEIGLIQSADDVCIAGTLRKVVQTFHDSSDITIVYGNYYIIDENGHQKAQYKTAEYSLFSLFSKQLYIPQPCAYFRMEAAKKLGGWDKRFPYCPDTELWFKLALHGKVFHINEFIGQYRVHQEQRDNNHEKIISSYKRMVFESEYLCQTNLLQRWALISGLHYLEFKRAKSNLESFLKGWQCAFICPPLLFSGKLPCHRLIPGYFKLTRLRKKFLFLAGSRSE